MPTTTTTTTTVLLVPHPAGVRPPRLRTSEGGPPWLCAWPARTALHRRKFIRTRAEYITAPDQAEPVSGEVGVWCEHEAPTTAVASSKRIGGWLHTIDAASITAQRDPVNHLNSDPWIWAPGFAWCVCQQRSSGKVRPAVAAREQGDIVVFGSPVDNQWVMDTVFVCGIRHSSMATLRSAAPEAAVSLSKCVLAPLRGVRGLAPLQGQPFSPHGVFSFAPVSIGATPRKRVNVSGILRKLRKRDGEPPALNNAQGLTTCTYKGTPSELWHELVAATLRAKYALGVGFTHPLDAAPWGRG